MYQLSAAAVPNDYLSCLCERNRALALHDRAEKKLCDLLLCSRGQVDHRLLQHRSSGRVSPAVMMAAAELQRCEALLSKADELLDLATTIKNTRQLDDDLRAIEC